MKTRATAAQAQQCPGKYQCTQKQVKACMMTLFSMSAGIILFHMRDHPPIVPPGAAMTIMALAYLGIILNAFISIFFALNGSNNGHSEPPNREIWILYVVPASLFSVLLLFLIYAWLVETHAMVRTIITLFSLMSLIMLVIFWLDTLAGRSRAPSSIH
ncbi:hypothetical protein FRB91_004585 [Serendipita sp. 411]|nr:hypothetical protein FRC18_010125 [Serendipita sp. 400]KAG8860192.1 hypothetical protein FRB91_004585 [Serendipita sp. 411]